MRLRFLPLLFTLILVFQEVTVIAQQTWKPVSGSLTTPWTDKVTSETPFPDYPRPTMTRRDWVNLNGLWDISLQDQGTGRPHKSGKILVPFPVESALSGCGWTVEPKNELIYTKKFFVQSRWKGQRLLLQFGAVDWHTTVFVNNKKVGEHKGGYDAFYFDITDAITIGTEAEISVHVTDPTDTGGQAVGKQALKPGGIFYTPTSGIWQTVWLEPVPQSYIKSYRVEPQPDKSRALIRVETEGFAGGQKVVASVVQEGRVMSSASGKAGAPLMVSLKDAHLWTLEDPFLYDIQISIEGSNGKAIDKVQGYFGLRKTSVAPDDKGVPRLMLNDKPIFQQGPLDQGFWPDGLYTAPNEEAMKYDIETLKSLGFNMIRKHVKVEPERWYYLCDKLGILVWQDMPSANPKTEEDKTQFKWEMKAMVDNLFNHPSIVMWVPFNEGWGQHDTPIYVEKLREWDPTRLINNASGWTDAGLGDVLDIHDYPGPSSPKVVDGRVAVLGEFGGLGLNVRGHQWTNSGWGYQQIETPEALLASYEELWRNVFYLEENEGLSAVVYTQVSDVETESNGLMTYDRKVMKMDPIMMRMAHRGQMPPKPKSRANIFVKTMNVELATIKPNALIEYAIDGSAPLVWQRYTAPFTIKNNTTIVTRAAWPDSLRSHEQRYVFTKTKELKPKGKVGKAAGLSAKIYEGSWEMLPDFSKITPSKTLTVSDLSLKEIVQKEDFAIVFEGWMEVPAAGVYTLHLRSDDGSRMTLDGQKIIDNDGTHGMIDKTVSLALKAGKHPFSVDFFQQKGGVGLEFWLEDAYGKRLEAKMGH